MVAISEINELEKRYGPSPEVEELRRRYVPTGNRDTVFGYERDLDEPISQSLALVLQGVQPIDDYLPDVYTTIADAQKDPIAYREKTLASMMMAEDMKLNFEVIDYQFEAASRARFGKPLKPAQVIKELSPFDYTSPTAKTGFFERSGQIITSKEELVRKAPFTPYNATELGLVVLAAKRLQAGDYETIGELGEKVAEAKELGKVAEPLFEEEKRLAAGLTGLEIGAEETELSNEGFRQKAIDEKILSDYFARQEQMSRLSLGGKIAEGVSALPAFMVEFLLTGGAEKIGNKFAREAAENITERLIKRRGVREVTRKVIGAAGGAVTRTAAMQSRVLASTFRNLTPGINVTPRGEIMLAENPNSIAMAALKGFGDVFIENLSEVSGPAISAVAAKVPVVGKLKSALFAAWKKKFPGGTLSDFTASMLKRGGYHGFLEELGEERVGGILRAIAGIEGEGNVIDRVVQSIPRGEDLLVELGVLSVPGAAQTAIGVVGSQLTAEEKTTVRDAERPAEEVVFSEDVKNKLDRLEKTGIERRTGPKTEEFKTRIKEEMDLTDVQTDTAMALVRARANALGQTTEQFVEERFEAGVEKAEEVLFQEEIEREKSKEGVQWGVKLKDGTLVKGDFSEFTSHADLVVSKNIEVEQIESAGFVKEGEFKTQTKDFERQERVDLIKGKIAEQIQEKDVLFQVGEPVPFDDAGQALIEQGIETGQITAEKQQTIEQLAQAIARIEDEQLVTESHVKEAIDLADETKITKITTPKEKTIIVKGKKESKPIGGPGTKAFDRMQQVYIEAGLTPPGIDLKEISPEQVDKEIKKLQKETVRKRTKRQEDRRQKAKVEFKADGKAVIKGLSQPDFSSVVHELAHVFRRTLDPALLTAAEKHFKVTEGEWTQKHEEKFARAFEKYLWEGKAPSQNLRAVFAKFRQWLKEIYRSIKGTAIDIKITQEVRGVFDKMLTGPSEIHPGEMTFAEFFGKMGEELVKSEGSAWMEKYSLQARETPHAMHTRLKKEWQARTAVQVRKGRGLAVSDLTGRQAKQIQEIEAATVADSLLESEKNLPIEELLDRFDSDPLVVGDFKEQLIEAFKTGKKRGINVAKQRYKDVLLKARARKELREHIQKLGRQIAKPAPSTVDLFYREAIAVLQAGIDPSFRANKTLADREATRKFLEKYPDAELPKKVMAAINKKALNEYTISELEALAKERKKLEHVGKTKKRLRLEREAKRVDEHRDKIVERIRSQQKPGSVETVDPPPAIRSQITVKIDSVKDGKPQYAVLYFGTQINDTLWELEEGETVESLIDAAERWLNTGTEDPINAATTKKPKMKLTWQEARSKSLRPSRIHDMLDGGKATFDGPMHEAFTDEVNKATDAELRAIDERAEAGAAKLEQLDLTLADLSSKRIIAGKEYTVEEIIGIYGFSKNPRSRLAVIFGNKIGSRQLAEIIWYVENTDPRLMELTNWVIEEFEQHYDRLENAFIEDQQKRLVKEDNYLPMRRQELDYTPDKRDLLDELKQSLNLKRAYTKKGFTLERQDIPAEFQKPIQLNLWSLWLQQVAWQEHYIHFSKLVRDLHRIERSKEFRSAVADVFGSEYATVTTNYVSRVANPYVFKSFGFWSNASRVLRNHAAVSYLAFNLVTMAKQLPSGLYYLPDAGIGHLTASAASFVANPLVMIEKVRRLDPQVRHPALERTLEELKLRNRDLYEGILKKVGKIGLQGIYLMDTVARTIGWNAVYQKALAEHRSEAEAIRLAQNATLRSQPAAAPKDLPEMYVSNEALNWFLMFSNQLNQIYNIATHDIPGNWKNKQYQKAGLAIAGLTLAAAWMWMIKNRRLPEDEEDFAEMLTDPLIEMVPLAGRPTQQARRGFGDTGIGPLGEIGKIAASVDDIVTGKGDAKDWIRIAESAGTLKGVPTVGPKRAIKAAVEGDLLELVGGEPTR
jgi:hypothetical protein